MTDDAPAIVAHGLVRRFGTAVAVDRLALRVARGSITALLGHNGAGKTTVVRLLNGVLSADGGRATVLGLDPWREGDALRRRTGVATERPSLDPRLSGRANLRLYAALYGVPSGREREAIDAVLERFGLSARGDDRVSTYSRGMTQRLALARCALHDPDLYFLDEPSAGLDPLAARDLRAWIAELARGRGKTVLLCTHDLGEAQRLADRVVVLRDGSVAAEGTPTELAARLGTDRLEIDVPTGHAERAARALAEAELAFDPVREDSLPPIPERCARLRLHVGADAAPHVARLLVGAEVDLRRLEPVLGSLEEVYAAVYEPKRAA